MLNKNSEKRKKDIELIKNSINNLRFLREKINYENSVDEIITKSIKDLNEALLAYTICYPDYDFKNLGDYDNRKI